MDEKDNGYLDVLYSTCVQEIMSFKSQQWHATNYALLLYGVVIAIAKTVEVESCIEEMMLFLLPVFVFGAGWYVVHTLFISIDVRRRRLSQIRTKLPESFMDAWRYGRSIDEVPDNPNEKIKLSWLFYSVLTLGLAVTLWVLWRT
ncbi:hypothetical protein [Spongiibacter tropicus]|uniref:hypothetical protein n=1 Tax=Spongiibacter tropicus TaxID=454602 RepID=UPI002357809E|nr:hypothetical protein [Spongiibacter tropicus]|tara:strand:+ start:11082 stop:11516 length:435 start_codon:yes stop_codon:yes gene_type:complete